MAIEGCFTCDGGHLARECPAGGGSFGKKGGDNNGCSIGSFNCGGDGFAHEYTDVGYGGLSSKKGGSKGCFNCVGDHIARECAEGSGEKGGGQRGGAKVGGNNECLICGSDHLARGFATTCGAVALTASATGASCRTTSERTVLDGV